MMCIPPPLAIPKIIEQSQSKSEKAALNEWEIAIADGEDSRCVCGNAEVEEGCFIQNKYIPKLIMIERSCIEAIVQYNGNKTFYSIQRIIDRCNQIFENSETSATPELIRYAGIRDALDEHQVRAYLNFCRKKKLSDFELLRRHNYNLRILYKGVAYQHLKKDPLKNTAGPNLVTCACRKEKITVEDSIFYNLVWDQQIGSLEANEVSRRERINRQILDGLKDEFD